MLVRYILLRLLYTIITMVCISFLVYLLVRYSYLKGDIFYSAKDFIPFVKGLLQDGFGYGYLEPGNVNAMIAKALISSLKLAIPSFLISLVIAFGFGVLGAVKRDTWLDDGVKLLSVIGVSLPPFWLAITLMFTFTMLPVYVETGEMSLAKYVLPVGTMSIINFPIVLRILRSAMIDTLENEYITLARVKGIPERAVIFKHALRNAAIVPLTQAGMLLSYILAGSIIVENIFLLPGFSKMAFDALWKGDFPIIQAYVMILTTVLLFINFFVDILYAAIDPQIRYQSIRTKDK